VKAGQDGGPLKSQTAELRRALLQWYDGNRRDLPWRRSRDPYHIWISEIMLQQTRVAAVLDHYRIFLERFPTIEKLAAAREASVLAAWSGLGYYRRARMMHAAAKKVMREFAGALPSDSAGLRQLPGIGRYTAAAVASIAHGEPVAAVDGNVQRVLTRVTGLRLAEEQTWTHAQSLIHPARPGDFNQAMMELGAMVCLPRQPLCLTCPLAGCCQTRGELPSLKKKDPQQKKEVHLVLDCHDEAVRLVQRPKHASLMPGMWELPEIPANDTRVWRTFRHSITVTNYLVRVVRNKKWTRAQGQRIATDRLANLPLTGLTRKILRAADII